MSDPVEPIPAAAQLWDELLQGREEQRQFREEFDDHRRRVKERHEHFARQLVEVLAMAESHDLAREDYEIEIKQLHTQLRQWYYTIIDLQKMVLLIAEHLEVERLVSLNPPLPLKSRERGAKEAA